MILLFFPFNTNTVCQAINEINTFLLKLSSWLKSHKLALNAEKTKYMVFQNYQRGFQLPPDSIVLNGVALEQVASVRSLEVTVHQHL